MRQPSHEYSGDSINPRKKTKVRGVKLERRGSGHRWSPSIPTPRRDSCPVPPSTHVPYITP